MLGIFAKDPNSMPVKTRLQLPPADAAAFSRACLADAIEAASAVTAAPVLFLALDADAELAPRVPALRDSLLDLGLDPVTWRRLRLERQEGPDLGARLENAFAAMHERPACIIGSDSPSLPAAMLEHALQAFETQPAPDLVLGPTADGGYYLIGCRQMPTGMLHGVAWSSARALHDTQERAAAFELRVALLEPWTDVDIPADMRVLGRQIAALRAAGDRRTARHAEAALAALGIAAGGAE